MTTDLWQSPNQIHFMGVTAHWIQSHGTLSGLQNQLSLRTDLIGFIRVPNQHSGDHLAQILLFVIERVKIANKVRIMPLL